MKKLAPIMAAVGFAFSTVPGLAQTTTDTPTQTTTDAVCDAKGQFKNKAVTRDTDQKALLEAVNHALICGSEATKMTQQELNYMNMQPPMRIDVQAANKTGPATYDHATRRVTINPLRTPEQSASDVKNLTAAVLAKAQECDAKGKYTITTQPGDTQVRVGYAPQQRSTCAPATPGRR
jgi:hypothetical protein